MIGNIKKQQAGFSIVEALVATGIFLVVFVLIADIAIMFNSDPERIIQDKKLESEADYIMEFLAQKIRLNTVRYISPISTPEQTLDLIDTNGNAMQFSLDEDNNLTYLTSDIDKTELNAANVYINNLDFYISPTSSPWDAPDLTGYDSNEQPRVTIVLDACYRDKKKGVDCDTSINLQTTVSSRLYER